MLRPRMGSDKNWPVTLVSEAADCSHTYAANTNYDPVKHLIKRHMSSVCLIENKRLPFEMSGIFF